MFEPTIRPADHWIDKVGIVGPDAEEAYKQSKTPRNSSKHMAVFPHALLHYAEENTQSINWTKVLFVA